MKKVDVGEKRKSDENHFLKKHVSAIHISAPLTALQRKLINVFHYNAYDNLLHQDTHEMDYILAWYLVGFESRNLDHFKAAITGIQSIVVEFDVMNDNGKTVWESMPLLSYARVDGGKIAYRYDKALAEKLYQPDIYAKLNLSVQRDIKGSHSLALYENCYRYEKLGITPEWELPIFLKLMGVAHLKSYAQFKELKRSVIDPAITEINKITNIKLTLQTIRVGRRVRAVRFLVEPNEQRSFIDIKEDSQEIKDIEKLNEYKKLVDLGAREEFAKKWLLKYGVEYVGEKIGITEKQTELKNVVGFLRSAIESDYKPNKDKKKDFADKYKSIHEKQSIIDEIDKLETYIINIKKRNGLQSIKAIKAYIETIDADKAKEYQEELSSFFSNEFNLNDYNRKGLDSLVARSDIVEYWRGKNVVELPSLEETAKSMRITKTIGQIEETIKFLKGKQSQ